FRKTRHICPTPPPAPGGSPPRGPQARWVMASRRGYACSALPPPKTRPFWIRRRPLENSPKGIHDLAQGQRAIASATLGQGPPPTLLFPKAIHTQRCRPAIGRTRSGIDIDRTGRRTLRTALNPLLRNDPTRHCEERTPVGVQWNEETVFGCTHASDVYPPRSDAAISHEPLA